MAALPFFSSFKDVSKMKRQEDLISCTRRFQIDTGHRVLGHESKCRVPHGHTYLIDVTCQAQKLDKLGRIIDFGQIKEIVGGWLDHHWDHNSIYHKDDPYLQLIDKAADALFICGGKLPYVLDRNPTAENLAEHLWRKVNELFFMHNINIMCSHIRIYETPNCWADYPVFRLEDYKSEPIEHTASGEAGTGSEGNSRCS